MFDFPEIQYEPFMLSRTTKSVIENDNNFSVSLQKYTNTLICEYFPITSSLTMKYINEELQQSLTIKNETLKKLKKKYNQTRNVNIIHEIILNDFNEELESLNHIQLIPNAQSNLMSTTSENQLIQMIIKQFEDNVENNSMENEYLKIYEFLNIASKNNFTNLEFINNNQSISRDQLYIIVQVWQIFEQFFKQFDYYDYLQNYIKIKQSNSDSKFILSIIRILLEIGPINYKRTQ